MLISQILRKILLAARSAPRFLLVRTFGIGPFHITPTAYKQYCVDLIQYLNEKQNRESILDIGCGLGDVLLAVDFRRRTGLDHNPRVIEALRFRAKLLPGRSRTLTSRVYKLGDGAIRGEFDYIVLCNWIHNVDPDLLRINIEMLFRDNLRRGGELIIDTVTGQHYPYSHDPNYLAQNIDARIEVLAEYKGGHISGAGSRRLVTIRK